MRSLLAPTPWILSLLLVFPPLRLRAVHALCGPIKRPFDCTHTEAPRCGEDAPELFSSHSF